MAFLHQIVERKRAELALAKAARSLAEVKAMIADAPSPRPFAAALRNGFGLIAEIKRKSPSGGGMRAENVAQAASVYSQSEMVKAISVLTNTVDFGMGIEEMARVKAVAPQPVLRKDFIFDEYQIFEARAFGADGLLLMANVLNRDDLRKFFDLSSDLGMDVLFEAHTKEEIDSIPAGAKIYGINSRKFMASSRWILSRLLVKLGLAKSATGPDLSVDLETFSLIKHLPKDAIKVAESGLRPEQIGAVHGLGYSAVLVGTSLLKAPQGIGPTLREFERSIERL